MHNEGNITQREPEQVIGDLLLIVSLAALAIAIYGVWQGLIVATSFVGVSGLLTSSLAFRLKQIMSDKTMGIYLAISGMFFIGCGAAVYMSQVDSGQRILTSVEALLFCGVILIFSGVGLVLPPNEAEEK